MDNGMHHGNQFTPFMQSLMRETTGKFRSAYCREDLLELHEDMKEARGRSAYASRRADLMGALTDCGISVPKDADDAALLALAQQVDDRRTIEEQLLRELHGIYLEFPSAEDVMTRLVRRLADPEYAGDPVRLAILKQFIKYTDYNTAPVVTLARKRYGLTPAKAKNMDTLLGALDEGIFDVLDTFQDMNKQQRRDARRKYALLRLADDLAHGWFRTNGKTKTDLYMFAFAFGMTVDTGVVGDVYDPERDVEKNLFRDYYQDNLLRYIADGYAENVKEFEAEPSGEGINYKNFAEVIYLYYLRLPRQQLSARDKIDRAEKMIDRCVRRAKENPDRKQPENLITDDYRDLFAVDIWSLEEGELEEYLLEHFHIPTNAGERARITVQWGQYAAVNNYLELLDQLEESVYAGSDYNGVELFGEEALRFLEPGDPFVALLRKMEQMLQLRIPKAATALASVWKQEGKEEQAWRLLAFAAGLDALNNSLPRDLMRTVEEQYDFLEGLQQSKEDKAAKQMETDSQYAARLLREELRKLRNAHGRVVDSMNHTLNNFRKQAKTLRTTNVQPNFLTVKGNLPAVEQALEELLAVAVRLPKELPALSRSLNQPMKWSWCEKFIERLQVCCLPQIRRLETLPEAVFDKKQPRWELTAEEETERREYEKDLEHLERLGRSTIIAAVYHNMISDQETRRMSMPALFSAFSREVDPVLDASRYQPISEKNLFDMFTLFELYHSLTLDR